MQFKRITEQQAWDSVVRCNQAFHGREFYPDALYDLLERHGYDYRQCVYVESWPEQGGDCGRLIGPGRCLLYFEVYPEEPGESYVEECVLDRGGANGLPRGTKPLSHLAMALLYYDRYIASRPEARP